MQQAQFDSNDEAYRPQPRLMQHKGVFQTWLGPTGPCMRMSLIGAIASWTLLLILSAVPPHGLPRYALLLWAIICTTVWVICLVTSIWRTMEDQALPLRSGSMSSVSSGDPISRRRLLPLVLASAGATALASLPLKGGRSMTATVEAQVPPPDGLVPNALHLNVDSRESSFEFVCFSGSIFNRSDFTNNFFRDTTFRNVTFRNVTFVNVLFEQCEFLQTEARLSDTRGLIVTPPRPQ